MTLGDTTENYIVKYIFNSVSMPNYGSGDLYVSLHTADPGEAGNQQTSEATYTSYARVLVTRTGTGSWTVSANQASNTAAVTFPTATGGSNVITHVAIGTVISATGQIIGSAALQAPITVVNGIAPKFAIGQLIFNLD